MSFTDDWVPQPSPPIRNGAIAGDGSTDTVSVSVGRPEPGLCILSITGELDVVAIPGLEKPLQSLFDAWPEILIVDLERLEFLGTTGLTILLQLRERAGRAGTRMHVAGLANRVVARPLQITQTETMFSCHLTLREARAACRTKE
jgi:anti-anti-sigma factor